MAGAAQTSKEHVGPSNARPVGTTRALCKSEAEPGGCFTLTCSYLRRAFAPGGSCKHNGCRGAAGTHSGSYQAAFGVAGCTVPSQQSPLTLRADTS